MRARTCSRTADCISWQPTASEPVLIPFPCRPPSRRAPRTRPPASRRSWTASTPPWTRPTRRPSMPAALRTTPRRRRRRCAPRSLTSRCSLACKSSFSTRSQPCSSRMQLLFQSPQDKSCIQSARIPTYKCMPCSTRLLDIAFHDSNLLPSLLEPCRSPHLR